MRELRLFAPSIPLTPSLRPPYAPRVFPVLNLGNLENAMKRFACALLFLLASVTNLQAQAAPFYQGKTIRIIVGNLAGDAYDLWARIFAQHMGKYIPGNPTFIVQNMTG